MKCSLNGQSTRVLGKAINSFSRIGNELYLEATPNGLILRTVNDSQTAFAVMNFEAGFFTDFKIDRSNSDEFSNKCKVSMKSCLGVFKNMRQVEKCQITLNLKTSKLLFQFNCLFDTIKTHNVSILEQQSLNAVYMTDNPPNKMTAPNKMFTEIISNFRMYDKEITIAAATDLVVLKNNIEADKQLMRTKLTLKSQEFTEYHISEPTTITFCLKELRAILNFADALSLDMTINFESAGKPVVFVFGSQDVFTANFVMSTLPPDDLSQTNASISAVGTKAHKNQETRPAQRSQCESTNFTLKLSDVIDLDGDDDVHVLEIVPTTITTNNNGRDKRDRSPVNHFATTLAATVTSVRNPTTSQTNSENHFPTTLATTVTSQRHPPTSLSNSNPTLRATESEEIIVSFRPESDVVNENVDEEMDVIPQSPQPGRRRRFKVFPRLYQNTQYLNGEEVLHENTDDEL